ncbi:MAG: hypothetical protein AUF79_13315 [Crenarchaeota archaeon 13_1_20CM_2_51_8]|nr:MAG: hypothetical protein AUF79_13315 [Crenarchaeota archaeon 13_1_20CM_2_51_8]
MSSIDDPILKELLDALKQDTQLMASDLLSVITTQALIAVFALFLAIASLARIILYEQTPFRMGGPGPVPGLFETALTFVLFALSVVSIYNLLRLRERYARLQALAEKLGR